MSTPKQAQREQKARKIAAWRRRGEGERLRRCFMLTVGIVVVTFALIVAALVYRGPDTRATAVEAGFDDSYASYGSYVSYAGEVSDDSYVPDTSDDAPEPVPIAYEPSARSPTDGVISDAGSLAAGATRISDRPTGDGVGQCRAELASPVVPPIVIRKFDAPKQAWGPGHRGADLAAVEGTPLLAPANGFISYAGLVAEKSVVSIRYRSLTLTFEPAQTELPIGTPVVKGMPFAVVAGLSNHCTGVCVHWGAKKSLKQYVDPVKRTGKRKIVLKPIEGR